MGKEKEKPQQITTQTNAPWDAAQPHLKNVMKHAQTTYNENMGLGPQLVPLNDASRLALDETLALSRQPVPGLGNAFGLANRMVANNGVTGDMNRVAWDTRHALSRAGSQLNPFASGEYQEDPRLQAMLDTNADRAANAAATRFGGGRYGSAAIGQGVGSAVADANNATMLQSNENARTRQLQAASTLGGLTLQGQGLLGQMYDAGAGRAMQAGALLPALNNLRYDGVSRAAGVGDYIQDRAQQRSDMKRNYPWEQLGQYSAALSGMGGLGGTRIGTVPKNSPSLAQGILGGAATGGALLGPWGAIGGGILGAFA